MSPIVVRFDLSPEAAEVAHRALGVYLDQAVIKPLAEEPVPVHTKRRLEEQKSHLEATRRDLKRAMDAPIEVGPKGESAALVEAFDAALPLLDGEAVEATRLLARAVAEEIGRPDPT